MKITNINHTKNGKEGNRLAFGSITLDKVLVVTGVSVFKSEKGNFVKLPQRKTKSGDWKDIVFPVTAELRAELNEKVLEKYEEIASSEN